MESHVERAHVGPGEGDVQLRGPFRFLHFLPLAVPLRRCQELLSASSCRLLLGSGLDHIGVRLPRFHEPASLVPWLCTWDLWVKFPLEWSCPSGSLPVGAARLDVARHVLVVGRVRARNVVTC